MKKITILVLVLLFVSINLFSASITRAYPSNFDALDIIYDVSMVSVDPLDYTLSGTATITFSSATIDGSDDRIVRLTGGSTIMIADLTLDTIDDTSSSLVFYAGLLPISNTNTNNPGGTIQNGYDVTLYGIISANDGDNSVWISDASGTYNGVLINSNSFDDLVNIGDLIGFCAQKNVINGNTVLESPLLLITYTTGNSPHGPDVINGSDINETLAVDTNPGESWEGQLVKIENVYVESYVNYDYRCTSDGGTTYFHVGDAVDNNFVVISLNVGSTYSEIIGVVDWDNSNGNYRINPRDADDIGAAAAVIEDLVITVNGADIDLNWTVYAGASSYNIYRSTDPNSFGAVYDTSATNSYTDVGAAGGVKYFYNVTAIY